MSDGDLDDFADRIVRTDFGAMQHLWQQRFGRPLTSRRDIVNWLCAEHGKGHSEANRMTLEAVVELIRVKPAELDATKQIILEAMPIGERLTGRQVADKLNGHPSYETIRTELPQLVQLGFLEQPPGKRPGSKKGHGYIRKM
ncbi:hypothetical protein [Aeoliella sp.]|uniref:hypothetical protein n=1 Tax=Aeoliella sp. TaxID=2795800 RepID=UPI003CCBFCE8